MSESPWLVRKSEQPGSPLQSAFGVGFSFVFFAVLGAVGGAFLPVLLALGSGPRHGDSWSERAVAHDRQEAATQWALNDTERGMAARAALGAVLGLAGAGALVASSKAKERAG